MARLYYNPSQFNTTEKVEQGGVLKNNTVTSPSVGDITKNLLVNKAQDYVFEAGKTAAYDYMKNAPVGSLANTSFTFVNDGISYTKGLLGTAADATKSTVGAAGTAISNALGTTAVNTAVKTTAVTGGAYLSQEAAANLAASGASSFSATASVGTAVIAYIGQKYLGGKAGTGATIGAIVGSFIPGVGPYIGATIGATIGSLFSSGKRSNRWQIARVGLGEGLKEGIYDHGYGYDASRPDERFDKYSQPNADAAVNISNYLGSLSKNLETLTGNKLTDTLFVKVGSRSGTHLIKNDEWQAHSKDPQSFVRQSVDIVVDMYGGGAVIDELATKYGITREGAGDKYNMYVLGAHQMELDAIQQEEKRQVALVENEQQLITNDAISQDEINEGTRRGMPTRPGTNSFTATPPGEVRTRQIPQRPQGLLSNAI